MAIDYKKLDYTACVYAIINDKNGKLYVGSAKNFRKRFWHHISDLNLQKHRSPKLQRAWNKYGEQSFRVVKLMEVDDPSQLIQYEQIFIDFYQAVQNGYNCQPKAASWLGRKHSKATKNKIKLASKKRWENPIYRKNITTKAKLNCVLEKRIKCVELDKVWNCIRDAAAELNLCSSSVSKVAKGKIHHINGFTFRYIDASGNIEEPQQIRSRSLRKKVVCDGVIYRSLTEAAKAVEVSIALASEVANGKRTTAKGHSFAYV